MEEEDMNAKTHGLSAAMLIAFAIPAAAHHSFAMFDRDRTVELQGAVKSFQWTNPHSFIDMYVLDPEGGEPVLWTLELGAVHGLADQGWKPKTLLPGDKIIVTVHPARSGSHYGQPLSVTLPNGIVMPATQGVRPVNAANPDN
jgi:hypothetical protein